MTLSDAMRLGAMATKPFTGSLINADATHTCALGAACVAEGFQILAFDGYDAIIVRWPELTRLVQNPIVGGKRELLDVIVALNDRYGWTREQIADWVETLKRAREAETQPERVEFECAGAA